MDEIKEKRENGDILNIVEQFITYFEEIDEEETDENRGNSGKCNG